MKIISQYLIILICLIAGEFISRFFNIPIPGNVLGMIILLIALISGIVKLEKVEGAASTLIKNLPLFFVPAGVGIMAYFNIVSKYAAAIMIATFLSTLLVLLVTGHITQGAISLKGRGNRNND